MRPTRSANDGKKLMSGKEAITVTTGADANDVFVSVADTGVGIDDADIDRIFLPFFTTKPVGKGTGQGLSITHSIVVDNHGGSIDIQSKPGQGSTFYRLLADGNGNLKLLRES